MRLHMESDVANMPKMGKMRLEMIKMKVKMSPQDKLAREQFIFPGPWGGPPLKGG